MLARMEATTTLRLWLRKIALIPACLWLKVGSQSGSGQIQIWRGDSSISRPLYPINFRLSISLCACKRSDKPDATHPAAELIRAGLSARDLTPRCKARNRTQTATAAGLFSS